jgi:PAS domain S-box-containing protein
MPHTSDSAIQRADRLEHELHVHQVELENQNEELRRTQSDLATARDRYLDLFDFAPVGYFTLDKDGVILECNLTGAEMLGARRTMLRGASLSRFIMHPDSDRWHLYLRRVLLEEQPQRIEIALRHGDHSDPWYGQIDSQRMVAPDQAPTLRVTMTDITERMNADAERRIAAIDADEREAERKRVALQLHEDLGQRLSALKMDLSRLSPSPAETAYGERLGGLQASLDDALATVRRITMDLRPPMLDDLGLVAAIDWLVRDTARRLGVPFTLCLCSEPVALGEHNRLAVYRFVQEAVALLVHDTGGTHLHVGLRSSDGEFAILLRAITKARAEPGAHVLDPQSVSILEHRARLLGGRLMVDSPRGHSGGWVGLELSLPTGGRDHAEIQPGAAR